MITGSKVRVLVIDDDRAVADTLVLVLNLSGYDAVAAYGGERGLELARLTAFSQLITEVMMNPLNGIQIGLAMRTISPGCRVLLISSDDQTTDLLAEAEREGCKFEILAKPVDPSVILGCLCGLPAEKTIDTTRLNKNL